MSDVEKLNTFNLYLFGGSLEKRSKLRNLFENQKNFDLVPCYQDDTSNISKLVRKNLKDFSNITQEVVNIIVESCGTDRVKLNNEIIDTLSLSREKFPGSSVSLDSLCKRYGIDNSRRKQHTALIDCDLLAKVYINLIDQKEPLLDFKNEDLPANISAG